MVGKRESKRAQAAQTLAEIFQTTEVAGRYRQSYVRKASLAPRVFKIAIDTCIVLSVVALTLTTPYIDIFRTLPWGAGIFFVTAGINRILLRLLHAIYPSVESTRVLGTGLFNVLATPISTHFLPGLGIIPQLIHARFEQRSDDIAGSDRKGLVNATVVIETLLSFWASTGESPNFRIVYQPDLIDENVVAIYLHSPQKVPFEDLLINPESIRNECTREIVDKMGFTVNEAKDFIKDRQHEILQGTLNRLKALIEQQIMIIYEPEPAALNQDDTRTELFY
jgi:hypothetical protein